LRQELESIDLKAMAASFKEIHETAGKPQALEDIKVLAETMVDAPDQEAVLRMGLAAMAIGLVRLSPAGKALGGPRSGNMLLTSRMS
jgi:uncharacterized protein with GYD domain